jgi:hypothetical protein
MHGVRQRWARSWSRSGIKNAAATAR